MLSSVCIEDMDLSHFVISGLNHFIAHYGLHPPCLRLTQIVTSLCSRLGARQMGILSLIAIPGDTLVKRLVARQS